MRSTWPHPAEVKARRLGSIADLSLDSMKDTWVIPTLNGMEK